MTHLILIRHGEVDAKAKRVHYGQLDVALSDRGRSQSRRAAERLVDTELDAVWSSDLQRARFLADQLVKTRSLEVQLDTALRERHVGVFQGLTYDEGKRLDPEMAERMRRAPGVDRPGDGENLADLSARVVPAIERICATARDSDRIAITCHAGPIRVILGHLLGIPFERLPRLRLDYCGMSEVEFSSAKQPRVVSVNSPHG